MAVHTRQRTTTPTDYFNDYTGAVQPDSIEVRGIRWARTGLYNAKGQPILKRLDKPIGFWANHDEPTYAIEDLY